MSAGHAFGSPTDADAGESTTSFGAISIEIDEGETLDVADGFDALDAFASSDASVAAEGSSFAATQPMHAKTQKKEATTALHCTTTSIHPRRGPTSIVKHSPAKRQNRSAFAALHRAVDRPFDFSL